MSEVLFSVDDLAVNYDHIKAVHRVDLEVRTGEIVALIGANGAGKSTTLKTVSGLLKPVRGSIRFGGILLNNLPPNEVVKRGVVQVPEGRAILTTMTVRENLLLGAYSRKDTAAIESDEKKVMARFPILGSRADTSAGNLSGGEQQMLAIGRALMAKPALLLLDEPSMGLAPLIVREIFAIIKEINKAGTAILVVEQNARQALKVADRGYVIENGLTVMTGTGGELLNDEKVIRAYLGG